MHFIKNVPIVIAGAQNTYNQRSACDNSTFSHYHSCDLYAESATNTIPERGICPLLLCTQFSALGSITTENSCGCYIVHRRSIMIGSFLPAQQESLFSYHSQKIRTVIIDGTPWFCVIDLVKILNFGNYRQALRSHVCLEDVQKLDTLTKGGRQALSYVNESGLYCLIFGSKLPAAKEFKKWVTSEVLPTIRKEGQYSVNNSLEYEEQRHQSLAIPIFTVEDFNQANFSLKNYQKIMSESFKFFTDAIFNVEVSDQKLAHTLIEMFNQLNLVARKAGGQERTKLTTFFVAELRKMLATLYKERYQLLEDNRELNHKLQQVKQVFHL